MIIAIGYHSSVDFYQQLHSRGLPEPGKNVAVLSAMSELAKARDVDHVIIFDTPDVLSRVSNAYCFDFKIIKKIPTDVPAEDADMVSHCFASRAAVARRS